MEEIKIGAIPQSADLKDKRFQKLKQKIKNIIKPPFRIVVLGQSGSGKSSFVYSLLRKMYKHYFDEIFIFSGTIDSNDAWGKIRTHDKEPPVIMNEYDPELMEGLLDDIEQQHGQAMEEGVHPQRILMVFDDLATDGLSNRHRMDVLDKIFVQASRHYNISVIIMTQFYNSLNRNQRAINLSHLCVYPINKNDVRLVAADHTPAGMNDQEFSDMYHKVIGRKDYNFLMIDYTKTPSRRFRDGMDKIIPISLRGTEDKDI